MTYLSSQERFHKALNDSHEDLDGSVLEDLTINVVNWLHRIEASNMELDGEESAITYYEDNLYHLSVVTIVELDNWMRQTYPTPTDLYNALLGDVELLDPEDYTDYTELVIDAYGTGHDEYAYNIAHSMIGSGVGCFELFPSKDYNVDLLCIV